MTRHRMRLMGANGATSRAWLDASRLSPDYAGVRCALAIGEEGGVVCIAVEGWRGTGDAGLRLIATEAVIAAEMSTMEGHPDVPLTDDAGRPVELEPGEDATAPIDDDVVSQTERLRRVARRLPFPWAPTALAFIATASAAWDVSQTDQPSATGIAVAVAIVLATTAFALYAWTCRAMAGRDADTLAATADREMERRRVLDDLVARTVAPR